MKVRKSLLLLSLLAVALPSQSMERHGGQQTKELSVDPKANPEAVVVSGKARFTVLTPEMIRIQYSGKGLFEDRATFAVINRRLPVPRYSKTEKDGWLTIKTSALTLRYKIGSELSDTSATENLTVSLNLNGNNVVWHPGLPATGNLKGTTRTLDSQDGDNKRKELEDGILSRDGWAILNESPLHKRGDKSTTFAFDKLVDGIPWWSEPVDKEAVDWYFFGYGHDYKRALKDFTLVAGKIPMPPLYIFGYWYSRYWRYTQQDFIDLVSEIEQNKIPLDVMIFDMDWHTKGWTGWTWDKSIIPDPEGLIKFMHDHKLKVALNLHPADGVDDDEEYFSDMVRDMHMAADTKVVPWQLTDSTFYRAMFHNILRKREAQGVDFWWIDWQQKTTSREVPGLGQTFWINHVFYNDMRLNRTDRRPVIFHRWGGWGSHRYPIGFSGDASVTFPTLAFQPYFTATASNVGFDYWGHDLGGHYHGVLNDPELYLRWMQFGVFTPIFRTHATSDKRIERRIWKYPNFEQLRQTVYLRYMLIPYIYNAARATYDTGIGMCRPLYYDWSDKDEAYSREFEDEYMFGDNILVAPIVEPSVPTSEDDSTRISRKTIWLPEGEWFDVCKQRMTDGGKVIKDVYTLGDIPCFIKAGAIIPCFPRVSNLKSRPDTLILKVVSGANGQLDYYEDAGDDTGYMNGEYTVTPIMQKGGSSSSTLTINPRRGSFKGMPTVRNYVVEFLAVKKPTAVRLNGKRLEFSYDASSGKAVVAIPNATFIESYKIKLTFR